MVLNSSPSKRPMGGQPKSEASWLSPAEVRRLWEEPTEAIPQNQREAAGILFLLGRGGCQLAHPNRALEACGPNPLWFGPLSLFFRMLLPRRDHRRVLPSLAGRNHSSRISHPMQ